MITSPMEIGEKVMQLNKDLGPIAKQIADLLEKFNQETDGWAADVDVDYDWHHSRNAGEVIGRFTLVKCHFSARERMPRSSFT